MFGSTPQRLVAGLTLALVAGSLGLALPGAHAQDGARATYDFEDGVQGFSSFVIKDNQPGVDAEFPATVTHDKALVKTGTGSLLYTYKVEPKVVRALTLTTRVPAGTRSLRFWVRSEVPTTYLVQLREEGGGEYQTTCSVPGSEWVQVRVNLDELIPGDVKDANGKLDVDQLQSLMLLDIQNMLVNVPGGIEAHIPGFKAQRSLWMDDLVFSKEAVPVSSGVVKSPTGSAYLVDNFESGTVFWTAAKATFGDSVGFQIFPSDVSLRILPEAAGPGMARTPLEPGGKGLRWSYKRVPKTAFMVTHSLEKRDLSKADRLRLSFNASRKSLLLIQLKEQGGAEYNFTVMPDDSVGWHTLELPFNTFSLSDSSKDDNNHLDPDKLKELSVADASAFLPDLPEGDTTVELDAIHFSLK